MKMKEGWAKTVSVPSILSGFTLQLNFHPTAVHMHERCADLYTHRNEDAHKLLTDMPCSVCKSTDKHRSKETEGKRWNDWQIRLSYWPTHQIVLRLAHIPTGLLSKSYPPYLSTQTHHKNSNIKSVWKRRSYSTRRLGRNQYGSIAVWTHSVFHSTWGKL